MEVAGVDLLADLKSGHIDRNFVRKVGHKGAHFELANGNDEFAAELYAFGVTGDIDRNLDCDRLGVAYCEEVHVERLVGYRVPLRLVKNCAMLFAVVEDDVDDVSCRGVGKVLKVCCIYSEDDVLYAVAVEVARHEAVATEGFDVRLFAGLADSALKFNVFH